MNQIVTRFAPSPTGYLHIGGARTALFNYLFAKKHGGRYRLRIEDTDKARSTEEAKQAILDGLHWLGLSHDDVCYQSEQLERHQQVAMQLLESGRAYRCYASPDELEAMRVTAREQGLSVSYDRRWRERDPADAPADVQPTIRIKAPLEEDLVFTDAVMGEVRIPAGTLDDFVLLRSDGTPTYMLAVVVDDHDMGVTHVIRGDDHLNNASRQQLIYQALGWDVPIWAHIPLLHGPDGAKLSKRHGALGVMEYAHMGYLPEAMRNYLLRLGWSHGDDELISDQQALEWFDLEHVQKSPARFDFAKLADLNGHYIRQADESRLCRLCLPVIARHLNREPDESEMSLLEKAMPALKERAKTLIELAESALFYFQPINAPEDEKAAKQLQEGIPMLQAFIPSLETLQVWDHETLFTFAKDYAKAQGLKLGALMAPIRVAITGRTGAPSMFEVMELLGKEETLARLKAAI